MYGSSGGDLCAVWQELAAYAAEARSKGQPVPDFLRPVGDPQHQVRSCSDAALSSLSALVLLVSVDASQTALWPGSAAAAHGDHAGLHKKIEIVCTGADDCEEMIWISGTKLIPLIYKVPNAQ